MSILIWCGSFELCLLQCRIKYKQTDTEYVTRVLGVHTDPDKLANTKIRFFLLLFIKPQKTFLLSDLGVRCSLAASIYDKRTRAYLLVYCEGPDKQSQVYCTYSRVRILSIRFSMAQRKSTRSCCMYPNYCAEFRGISRKLVLLLL